MLFSELTKLFPTFFQKIFLFIVTAALSVVSAFSVVSVVSVVSVISV